MRLDRFFSRSWKLEVRRWVFLSSISCLLSSREAISTREHVINPRFSCVQFSEIAPSPGIALLKFDRSEASESFLLSSISYLLPFGGHKAVVRPVPIPNTAVKHSLADGSGFIDSARVGCRQFFLKSRNLYVSAFLFPGLNSQTLNSQPSTFRGTACPVPATVPPSASCNRNRSTPTVLSHCNLGNSFGCAHPSR